MKNHENMQEETKRSNRNMRERIWLSYDFGVNGDYEGIYQWLDDHGAVECGDSCASLLYERHGPRPLEDSLRTELKRVVQLRARDRIYLISRTPQGKWIGRFIWGRRKAAAWAGYAAARGAIADE